MQGYQRPNATARCNNLKGSAVNVDLSCSAFDPGDALPDYSGTVPRFARRLQGDAVGIRSINAGVGQIGLRKQQATNVVFTPGANVFPLADTTLSGDTIDRKVSPDTNDVNSATSYWRSPQDWTSIVHTPNRVPLYFRFKNEFLGASSPTTGIARNNATFTDADAQTSTDLNCQQADDSTLFPTRTARSNARIAALAPGLSHPISISPNPTVGPFELVYHVEQNAKITIRHLATGKEVFLASLPKDRSRFKASIQAASAGIYIVEVAQPGLAPSRARLVLIK